MNARHALVGSLIAAIAIGAFDEYRISRLQGEVAYLRMQLQFARAADRAQRASNGHPDVQQAIAEREQLWNRTFRQSDTCQKPPDANLKALCAADYATAREEFFVQHPLTEFMDAQQR